MSKDLLLFLVCFSDMFSLLGWTKRSHFRVGPLIHAGSFLTPTGRTTSDLNKMTSHHLARMSEAKQLNCLITIYLLYLPQLWLTPLQKNVPTQRGSPTQTTPLYLIQVCKWLGTPTLLLGVPPQTGFSSLSGIPPPQGSFSNNKPCIGICLFHF
jgi:hypothetical protein